MTATSTLSSDQISFRSLVLTAVGEYTARSVAADPLDAASMHLVKQQDGNFAAPTPKPFLVSGLAAGRSAAAVQSALYGLSLGG